MSCNNILKEECFKTLEDFINELPDKKGSLISVLHKAQDIFGYLPAQVQEFVAEKLDLPISKVYGVVSFYHFFTMVPKGKYPISVCMGTACYVRGAEKVLNDIKDFLKIGVGETTLDGLFSLDCLRCVGASKGLIYIRAEYPVAVSRLEKAISTARERGYLGNNILGSDFSFDIDIKLGAGAFVCGEETALIHSMEGERGEPTTKPPFPAESGYWGKPTNVNNVETFANITKIILNGVSWFRSIGTPKSPGTKVFALAGKVNNVGLVEVPMGTTLREVIFEIGDGIKKNKKFKAVQTGGPSGGCLTEQDLDTPIDFDTLLAKGSMMGSGGMIVMDETDCMVSIAKFYLEFTLDESCGKCTPCRIGNTRLHEILERITNGNGKKEDLDLLRELSTTIKDTALCGLGQTSPNPVLSTLNKFYDEYLAHIEDKTCPAKQCKNLIKYEINPNKCIGCTLCARRCPVQAIESKLKTPHIIDQSKCIKCGACFENCKFEAVEIA